jgi:hypothetical protein
MVASELVADFVRDVVHVEGIANGSGQTGHAEGFLAIDSRDS